MSIAVKAEHVGKKYTIGHRTALAGNESFAAGLARNARQMLGRSRDLLSGRPIIMGDTIEEVWALEDVSFEIASGEAVGIIGRNGAGKSTLLKILSRITDPTTGRIEVAGRVASLLEVGTGFHQELSGRENIYLNGGILGMTRSEIRQRFDSIVAFAGVERYIDTPVKRYSSGMYVRLAFAIAAHLEPEILIIDEVLAVGDIEFQKRCLGKMDEVANSGRTVLFVSHIMPMVASLCGRCLVMEGGRLVASGPTPDMIHRYQAGAGANAASVEYTNDLKRPGDDLVSLLSAWVETSDGAKKFEYSIFEPLRVCMNFRIHSRLRASAQPNFHLFDSAGNCVFVTSPHDWPEGRTCEPGDYIVSCTIPAHLLNDGMYAVAVALNHLENGLQTAFFERGAMNFCVVDPIDENPHRESSRWGGHIPGAVRPLLSWRLEDIR